MVLTYKVFKVNFKATNNNENVINSNFVQKIANETVPQVDPDY